MESVRDHYSKPVLLASVLIGVLLSSSSLKAQEGEDTAPTETTVLAESEVEYGDGGEEASPVGMATLGATVGVGFGSLMYWGLSRLICDDPPCLGGLLTGFLVVPLTTGIGAMVGAGSKRNPMGALLGAFSGIGAGFALMGPMLRSFEPSLGLFFTTVGVLVALTTIGAVMGSIHGWNRNRYDEEGGGDEASQALRLHAGIAPMPGGVMAVLGGEL